MSNKQKFKELALIYLVAIILLFGTVIVIDLGKTGILSITGFAVADNESNETIDDEAQSDEDVKVIDLSKRVDAINETITGETEEEGKQEKEEKEKPEKAAEPEPNTPPVWKSDVEEFIINGKTIINLNDYFEDKNNDTIAYSATPSEPDKIKAEIDHSLITITPAGNNFNSTITIAASDGEKTTTRGVNLIVPERKITIDLEYKSGSVYDADDDGVETTAGVIDLTVEDTQFNWDVNENNLCTRWETYSVEDEASTIVCYGSSKCCQFVDMLATRPLWNEPFHSSYGTYGAGFNNIVSAQALYVDYDLNADDPYAEIYSSEWMNLAASYYTAFTRFEDICVDTCLLKGFNDTSYKLIFEIDGGATLELNSLAYTLVETIDNVLVNLDVEDNHGITSGTYKLYKDNVEVAVVDNLIEPDYYDIEVVPEQKVINKLLIKRANITEPLTADIGVDDVGREQQIKDVEVKKQYAIDASEIKFETATLTATAEANALFKCRQWDYSTEVCYGTWEKVKDLVAGQEYEITITADDPGFVEGNLNITIAPITELALIKNIQNITIIKNNNYTIDLSQYFSNIDNNTIFAYNEIDNISIAFENNMATIILDKDFIGTRFTFITATKEDESAFSNVFKITATNETIDITPEIMLDKKDFKFDEDVELDFEYLEKEELIEHGKWKEEYEVYEEETELEEEELELLREKAEEDEKLLTKEEKAIKKQKKKFIKESESIETFVYDDEGNLKDIEIEIEELREGRFDIKIAKQRAFRAGKYTIKLELIKDNITYAQQQDFTWGVLAINVNKSIHLPNEDSFIGIGVLDDKGKIVCNADVALKITNPLNQTVTLTTSAGDIKISPECETLGVTELPDYYTSYKVSGVGNYIMNLTAATFNGIRSIEDNFTVANAVDFDVARKGPTRIYPVAPYTMNISIIANQNYNGIINEYVPAGFDISNVEIYEVSESEATKLNVVNEKEENGFHSQATAPRQDLVSHKDMPIKQYLFKYVSVDESALTELGSHSQAIAPDRGSGFSQGSAGSNFFPKGVKFPPPASKDSINQNSIDNNFDFNNNYLKENEKKENNSVVSTTSRIYTSPICLSFSNLSFLTLLPSSINASLLNCLEPFITSSINRESNLRFSSEDINSSMSFSIFTDSSSSNSGILTFNSDILTSPKENNENQYIKLSNKPSAFNNNINFNNKNNNYNNIENKINENNNEKIINKLTDFFTLIPSVQAQQDNIQQNNIQNNIVITTINDTKIISIPANLKKGKKYVVSYKFDAPDISPEFYLLGPLDIGAFKEARNWQIASDAPTAKFFDGFEDGSLSEWTLIAASGANNCTASITDPFAGTYHAECKPQSTAEPASVMEIGISMVGFENITFSYYRKLVGLDIADEFKAKWYDGTSWIAAEETLGSSANDAAYVFKAFNLTSTANNNPNFKIRFECTAGAVSELCRIDNVTVQGEKDSTAPLINSVSDLPDPVINGTEITITANITDNFAVSSALAEINGTNYTMIQQSAINGIEETLFKDDFELGALKSKGWVLNSTGGFWGVSTNDPMNETYHAQAHQTGAGDLSYMEVKIDTTGHTNISFSYYRKLVGLDAADDFAAEWYSGSAWVQVEQLGDGIEDNANYVFKSSNLTTAANNNPNFKIRFLCENGAVSEYCRIDNITVKGIASAGSDSIWKYNYKTVSNGTFAYTVYANDTSGNRASQTNNFTVIESNITLSEIVRDSNGTVLNTTLEILEIQNESEVIVYNETKVAHIKDLPKGRYNVKVKPKGHIIKEIAFSNLSMISDINDIIDVDDPNNANFMELYALSTSITGYSGITITATAKGTKLYRCTDWDFAGRVCNGYWVKQKDLSYNEEYILNATSAYAETGLIAINTHKSIYLPNEIANISMGVLDTDGFVICDANVTLLITNPNNIITNLTTIEGGINVSNECSAKNKTYVPDYSTNYTVNGAGDYFMNATAVINASLKPNITSNFEVRDNVAFDVIRSSATRILPTEKYTMNFTIKANMNFTGNMTEVVEPGFAITSQSNLAVETFENYTLLRFDVAFVNGSTYSIGYEYDAPDISPEFYLLGPLRIGNFTEARVWQIANDAPAKIDFTSLTISDSDALADATATIAGSCINNDCGSTVDIFLEYTSTVSAGCLGTTEFLSTTCAGEDALAGLGGHTLDSGTCTSGTDPSNSRKRISCTTGQTFSITYRYEGCLAGDFEVSTESATPVANTKQAVCPININVASDTTKPIINATLNNTQPEINDIINISANASDETALSTINFTINFTTGLVKINYTVSGTDAQRSNDTKITDSAGNVLNITAYATDSSGNVKQNSTKITVADLTAPIVNTTFNKSINLIEIDDVINFTGNITDETQLLSANITHNMSATTNGPGVLTKINFTLSGTTAGVHNVTQITCGGGCVINFTMYATDTSNNVKQNSTKITVVDVTLPVVNTSLNKSLTNIVQNDMINISANITDETGLLSENITYNMSNQLVKINFTISGTTARIHNVTEITVAAGEVINFTVYATDTSNNVKQNSTLITVADLTFPIVNTTFNKSISLIEINDLINFTGNITDETGLLSANITYNMSGVLVKSNFSFAGETSAQVSNKTVIVTDAGSVINFTMYVTDTSNNVKQNSTLVTVAVTPDTTKPRINASLNISQINLNQVVNMTANVSDEAGLSFCRFVINQTGAKEFFNTTVVGTNDQCSQNFTIALGVRNVINFTVIVNDTSTATAGGNLNQSEQIVTVVSEVAVTNCSTLSTANANYTLINDANSGKTCFYIQADNITLDCKGYEINYSQSAVGYGINISGYNYTRARSCDIVQADLASDNSDSYGVYIFSSSINNSIYNSTITTLGSGSYGAYLFTTVYNNSIYNNSITGAATVVALEATSYSNFIYDNAITATGASSGVGVRMYGQAGEVYGNFIYNNTITTIGGSGFFMQENVHHNSIYNNTITTSTGKGMEIDRNNFENSISDNTITTSGANANGINFDGSITNSYNNSIYNNIITTSGSGSHGIYMNQNIYSNRIYGNSITTQSSNAAYGIYLEDNINNNTFYRNNISSFAAAIVINGSVQSAAESTRFNNFTNDTIIPCKTGCADNYFDIILTSNVTDITFLNVSFNKSRISIVSSSGGNDVAETNNLTVQWYLNVNITNSSNNNPIAGAWVMINDSFNNVIFNNSVDDTGSIPTQTVTEFTMINGTNSSKYFTGDTCVGFAANYNITCFTPYNISVNFTGYNPANKSIDINRSKFVNISMSVTVPAPSATAPVIRLNNVSTFAVDPVAGSSVGILISFNVTDADGVGTVNATKAVVNLTLGYDGGQWRSNVSEEGISNDLGTCANGTHAAQSIVQINCTVNMRYYDNRSANWFINVSVKDIDGLIGRNGSAFSFTYNSLSSFKITSRGASEQANLNFSGLNLGAQNQQPKAPLLLNNTGNADFDLIRIMAANLVGITTATETIAASSFFVNATNITATPGLGAPLSATANVTIRELAQTATDTLDNVTLLHGPGVSGDAVPYLGPTITKGNQTLVFWIDVPSSGLSAQTYNNTWNMTVVDLP